MIVHVTVGALTVIVCLMNFQSVKFGLTGIIWVVLILTSGCGAPELIVEDIAVEALVPGAPPQPFSDKARVQVDLQDGFKEEEVAVYVEGQKRFSRKINTNQATGLAERLEFEWEKPEFTLGIVLKDEKREWRCRVKLEQGIHLGVNWVEGRIRIQQSSFPFGYM